MQEEKVNFSLLHPLSPTPQGLLTVRTNFKTTNIRVQRKSFLQPLALGYQTLLSLHTEYTLKP